MQGVQELMLRGAGLLKNKCLRGAGCFKINVQGYRVFMNKCLEVNCVQDLMLRGSECSRINV